MQALLSLKAWIVVSLVWAATIGFLAWETWPRLPLDVSPNDPGTLAAHSAAVDFHLFQYGTLGLLVPAALFAVGWIALNVMKRRAQS